eukprot:TRINITY_DN11259_c0_g1_i10.p1 TRINITY_DN11259_c0_g1~~TRINITY_DN11259_c0_g1_i10.p1  ORF type:complete len:175 (-),score=37.38 TRINITY_DN11259_c0_g1_i10:23-547(-)
MCEDAKMGGKSVDSKPIGEIRLKKDKLPTTLINAVRQETLKRYIGRSKDQLLRHCPMDREVEVYVLSLCCNMLREYYFGRHKTGIGEDMKLLEDKSVKGHMRVAVKFRLEAKRIVISNIRLLEILLSIVNASTMKDKFKEGYMKRIEGLEGEEDVIKNRRALRRYLRSYYHFMN